METESAKCKKTYRARPDVKSMWTEYVNQYIARPDVTSKRNEYMQQHMRRPDVESKLKEYMNHNMRIPHVRSNAFTTPNFDETTKKLIELSMFFCRGFQDDG